MTKIEQGILINSQHLYNVLNNIPEETSFKDQILALGYETIEDFFEEKTIYEMQQILKDQIIPVAMKDIPTQMWYYANEIHYGILSVYTNETCICRGDDETKPFNEEYCKANNIPIYPYYSFGGNIVATKEDFGIVVLLPTNIDISPLLILNGVANILKKYFENVEVYGNDILIGGKKVIGSMSFGNEEIFVMAVYFCASDKGDLIEKICGEPITDKTPGYINTEILSTDQLRNEVLLWLQGL